MVLDKGNGGDDPGEEFFNVSTPLSGLDKLQAQSQEHMASVSGVPLVKLLGITPSGLNASTDGEVRVFYDSIHAYQGKLFTENLEAVLGIIQMSEFGEIDPDIGFEYEPLWSLDEEAAAAVRKTEAETDAVLVGANVISVSEARHRIAGDETTPYMSLQPDAAPPLPEEKRVTLGVAKAGVIIQAAADGLYPEHAALEGLRDTGLFPGISAVDIALAKDEPPAPDNDPEPSGQGEPGTADDARDPVAEALAADAAPAPLYVHRKVLNAADVIAWAVSQGLPVTVPAEAMHVTVARSRAPLNWMGVPADYAGPSIEVPAGGPRLVERFGEAVVLSFASEMLVWRWQAFRDAGASWDHEGYQPHVTLAYGAAPVDLAGVEPYAGPLVLGPEIFGPLAETPLAEAV